MYLVARLCICCPSLYLFKCNPYLAEVRITFIATCRPLSYYGPSARLANTSASARSNTESDAEINSVYRPLSPKILLVLYVAYKKLARGVTLVFYAVIAGL